MWVTEEHRSQRNNAAASEDDTHKTSIEEGNVTQVPSDEEVRAAAEKQNELILWAQSLTQEQINFLCDGGWFNKAAKGYAIRAAKEMKLSEDQTQELLRCYSYALDVMDKEDAEKLYTSI